MKKILLINITLAVAILSGSSIFAQEKPPSGNPPRDSKEKTSSTLLRAKARADFVGVVTQVDPLGKTVAVKNKGVIVTFDVANPVLKGYKSLEQIRKGDRIAVSYTAGGAKIARATGREETQPLEGSRPGPESTAPKQDKTKTSAKTKNGRPMRVRERTNSVEFRDVDNNGDGKITPVELCTVVPDLTVEKFKTYDKNGDGSLSNSEYSAVMKSLPNGR